MMSESSAGQFDEQTAMAAREHLVESNFDEMLAAHREAKEHGAGNPVVFLVDCEDEIGSEIARAWEGHDAVDDAIANAQRTAAGNDADPSDVATTILVRAFSFADCREEVPEVFPYLAESFQQKPPVGQFLIVAVTAGGAATFTAPLS